MYGQVLAGLEQCRRRLPADPVVHLHIPKTAGTSLCTWANESGLGARRLHRAACHFRGDGPFWLGAPAVPASCERRRQEASAGNVSWMSVERWVDLPLCEGLQYVVALRSPVARTLHHFIHLVFYFMWHDVIRASLDTDSLLYKLFRRLWRLSGVREHLSGVSSVLKIDDSTPSITLMSDFLDLWLGMASNYQVRSLAGAGKGAAYLEDGAAAGRRLAAAVEVLEQFDVVLAVGGGGLGDREERLLRGLLRARRALARRPFRAVSHMRTPGASQPDAPPEPGALFHAMPYEWGRGELEETQARNAADTALVMHAKMIQSVDLEYVRKFALASQRRDGRAA